MTWKPLVALLEDPDSISKTHTEVYTQPEHESQGIQYSHGASVSTKRAHDTPTHI